MKQLFILFLTGCAAHQITRHDYCIQNADHYQNYDECYQEVSKLDSPPDASGGSNFLRGLGKVLKATGDGMRGSSQSEDAPKSINCTSLQNGSLINTSCF